MQLKTLINTYKDGEEFSLIFKEPGNHTIEYDNKIIDKFSVNITRNEINNNYLNLLSLKNIFPSNTYITHINENVSQIILKHRNGYEIWHYFLYFIIIILCFEMYISNALKKRK